LNETENTLKFGVFMLALYYFKALTTVRREKASWQGKDDRPDGPVVRPITLERRRLASEQKALEARRLELHKVRHCLLLRPFMSRLQYNALPVCFHI
jgi:hypothetical protein